MNIVLIGQKWLCMQVLYGLVKAGLPPAAVLPDATGGSLENAASGLGIPVMGFGDAPGCDLMLAAHCHRFIPAPVRERSRLGVLAYHPSLLPRHRGRDAIHWTLAMGDPIAGGTTYWMDDGADTGPMESQDWCHVAKDDTPATLWRRALGPMGVRMLLADAMRLASGAHPARRPQDEAFATWEPALSRPALKGQVAP